MIYVKEGFKNRKLVQERQTIPREFVYELRALVPKRGNLCTLNKSFVLSMCAHMHASKYVCVCVCVLQSCRFYFSSHRSEKNSY